MNSMKTKAILTMLLIELTVAFSFAQSAREIAEKAADAISSNPWKWSQY